MRNFFNLKIIFLVSFLSISNSLPAQEYPYRFVSQIDSMIKKNLYEYGFQYAATDYSMIGEYEKMLKTVDLEFDDSTYAITPEERNLMLKYKPIRAADFIIHMAKKTRIIIFNEAHYQPMHRAFVTSLLPLLKNLGYDFLGIEALAFNDSLLAIRKYPEQKTGFYIREPCFGNLIRTGLEIGLKLFPYDAYADTMEIREIREARNIKDVIDKNPDSKFIIYCGFDHAIKDSSHTRMVIPMAGRLKQLTGIDPFTIDQVQLTEKSNPVFENHFRQLIDLSYAAVFIDSNYNAFNKANQKKSFDCNVYHPNTVMLHGRPNWLYSPGKMFVDIQKKISINYPCLVKVFDAKDNTDTAVPIDLIELTDKYDNKQILVNKAGKYIVVVTNLKGESQRF